MTKEEEKIRHRETAVDRIEQMLSLYEITPYRMDILLSNSPGTCSKWLAGKANIGKGKAKHVKHLKRLLELDADKILKTATGDRT